MADEQDVAPANEASTARVAQVAPVGSLKIATSPGGDRYLIPGSYDLATHKGDGPPPGAIPLPPSGNPHPWATTTAKARQGVTPDNKPIGEQLIKPFTNPESIGDYATGAAITAPLVALGGAGAPALAARLGAPAAVQALAPAAGRVAVQGGAGALRGEGLKEAGYAALLETALPGLGKVASKVPYANKVFQPAEAITEIEKLVGQGKAGPMNVNNFRTWLERFNAAKSGPAKDLEARRIAKQIADPTTGLGNEEAAYLFTKYVAGGKVSPSLSEKATKLTSSPNNVAQAVTNALGAGTPLGPVVGGVASEVAKNAAGIPRAVLNLLPWR